MSDKLERIIEILELFSIECIKQAVISSVTFNYRKKSLFNHRIITIEWTKR